MAQMRLDPTVAGGFSVLIWGCAIPIAKSVEDRIGLVAFLGFAFTAMAVFGAIKHLLRHDPYPAGGLFRDAWFYARWVCFVLHEGLLASALVLVQRRHLPLVILLNYLWPTTVILFSIALGAVAVVRRWRIGVGSLLVVSAIGFEVLGSHPSTHGLFVRRADCVAYLLVFAGALCWGLYSAISRRFAQATGGASVLPLFQATLGVMLVVSFLHGGTSWYRLTPATAALLSGYCVLLFMAYLTWDLGMRSGNVILLSLFADLIPWLSLLTTSILLRVAIPGRAMISAVVLVAGAIVTRLGTMQSHVTAAVEEPAF